MMEESRMVTMVLFCMNYRITEARRTKTRFSELGSSNRDKKRDLRRWRLLFLPSLCLPTKKKVIKKRFIHRECGCGCRPSVAWSSLEISAALLSERKVFVSFSPQLAIDAKVNRVPSQRELRTLKQKFRMNRENPGKSRSMFKDEDLSSGIDFFRNSYFHVFN